MLRNNLLYILLGFIAVILIGLTIALQLTLLSERTADQTTVGSVEAVKPPSIANNANDQVDSAAFDASTTTSAVVVVQSADAAAPDNEPTSISIAPTSTASLLAASSLAASSTAEAEALTLESSTAADSEQPDSGEATATEASVPISATSTAVVPAEFVFAYITGRAECDLITDIVVDLFDEWGWSTQKMRFSNIEKLFDSALYEGNDAAQPDLTFCYRDPEDREQFFAQNGTELELIASGYTNIDGQKHYVLAHSSVPVQLRYENTCVLNFLRELAIDSSTLTNVSNASEWMAQNSGLVQSWGSCSASTN